MSAVTTRRRVAVVFAALFLLAQRGSTAAAQAAAPSKPATCVFTNPAYSGKCTETTSVAGGSTAEQACKAILQCLNDVGCLKTYCQATTLRSGWKLESAR